MELDYRASFHEQRQGMKPRQVTWLHRQSCLLNIHTSTGGRRMCSEYRARRVGLHGKAGEVNAERYSEWVVSGQWSVSGQWEDRAPLRRQILSCFSAWHQLMMMMMMLRRPSPAAKHRRSLRRAAVVALLTNYSQPRCSVGLITLPCRMYLCMFSSLIAP